MKKIGIIISLFVMGLALTGCTEKIEAPDFFGKDYSEVITWAEEFNVNIVVTSDYNDDVLPNSIYYQEVTAGTQINPEDEFEITYSRGYSPNGIINVLDFTGKGLDEINEWLTEENITKFSFKDVFSSTQPVGEYVGYDVTKSVEREEDLRKDSYTFYFSRGALDKEEVAFTNPEAIRGVNLGGWFVLEGWMTPDLFNGLAESDETYFVLNADNAEARLETHWNTFITEDDFAFLSDHGINYIRLPIPWWYQGEEFTYTHEGETHTVNYPSSKFYIDRAMTWAEEYGIDVLLDLHTAPGGQNGFDNGGISGVLQWEQPENVQKTIEVLKDIATDYKDYNSLWGIELLNEPGWGVDLDILMDFYEDAYLEIRKIAPAVWIGMHDGFRMYLESEWSFFFRDNDFHNVFFDIHLYQTFGDGWADFDISDHLEWVEVEQYKAVHRYDGIVDVVVGEWSLGLQGNVYRGLDAESIRDLKIAFGNKQLNVYEHGFGWFFWNYKIDQSSHLEWDMKRLIETGIFPDNFETN